MKTLTELEVKNILNHWDEDGWSIRKISKETGHCKHVIRKYLKLHGRKK